MVDRLAEDNRRAKRIAEGLHALDPRLTDPLLVETNIVMLEIGHSGADAATWISALEKHGLKAGAWNRKTLRHVTHRHLDDAAVEHAVAIVRTVSTAIMHDHAKVSGTAV